MFAFNLKTIQTIKSTRFSPLNDIYNYKLINRLIVFISVLEFSRLEKWSENWSKSRDEIVFLWLSRRCGFINISWKNAKRNFRKNKQTSSLLCHLEPRRDKTWANTTNQPKLFINMLEWTHKTGEEEFGCGKIISRSISWGQLNDMRTIDVFTSLFRVQIYSSFFAATLNAKSSRNW